MPLPPKQLKQCLGAVGAFLQKLRPPPEIRDKLDYHANITGCELVLIAVRPSFQDKIRTTEHPIARAKWVATRKRWRLYWMRADMKWHSYEPMPEAATMAAVLSEIRRDPHCCFFG